MNDWPQVTHLSNGKMTMLQVVLRSDLAGKWCAIDLSVAAVVAMLLRHTEVDWPVATLPASGLPSVGLP